MKHATTFGVAAVAAIAVLLAAKHIKPVGAFLR